MTSLVKSTKYQVLREVTSLVKTVLRYHNPERDYIISKQY